MLDLLVVSIASDIVPVTGENRVHGPFRTEKTQFLSKYRTENHHAIFRFKYGRKIGE